ncbi:MAG: double zinc ribbon domain-containing protein [Patescibacteria group bacterium]
MIAQLKDKVLDFLFPPFCVACGQAGEWWCEVCRQGVQVFNDSICPRCLSLKAHECGGGLPFDHVWSLGYYHDPKLRAAITALKFNGTSALLNDLKIFIKSRLPKDLPHDAILVPMPLSDKRHKERGFNQAELIASLFGLPVVKNCLIRKLHCDPQSSVAHDLAARQINVKNCFVVQGLVPKHVILVDDVITTGATAAEAAKVILASGAESVSVLTLAIGA